ncbi:MAG: flagellar biosynthesis regulator FlhF [Limisphaerales bacterium]|nr:MAG: flagellar biosynthesis regulator FlhF [Limisphaerales bacterium]KAG0507105.1 MAG: flagellar biosynthesis regulator FlhF [Limisphaerales bacterium]TXT49309.1 MAG: flagellar biosynthesis regulator FlhF [Limisphaerales bacterium]
MPAQTFIAASAAEAVAQIRAQLGPEAVVLNVRQLPAAGLSRLWQKPHIEVTATVPEPPPAESDQLGDLRREIAALRELVVQPARSVAPSPAREESPPDFSFEPVPDASGWRIGAVLQRLGLLPLHAQRVVERLQLLHGEAPPSPFSDELAFAREVLAQLWNAPALTPAQEARPFHVFVGPPGVGKTTALCKWLTQSVLLEGRPARVWRLDGQTANTAESLSVHGEILGVPVERAWDAATGEDGATGFVDLPGVEVRDAAALESLRQRLALWPHAQVHLTLNAAYDTQLLLAQARAWSSLPVTDLILTHLDEEPRHGKFWNLVLGTKFALRFLGAGQNVPGDFRPANPDALLASTFAGKSTDSRSFAPAGHRWQTTC